MDKLLTPQLTVTMSEPTDDEPNREVEYVVQTNNRDAIAWDMQRARFGWPAFQEAMFLYFTVLAYNAMKRDGSVPVGEVTEFIDRCIYVQARGAQGQAVTADDVTQFARPTPPAHVTD